jgi:hypothetical protein
MVTPHRTQYISYLEENTRGTDQITVAENKSYYFGVEKAPIGNFPGFEIDPHITYYGDSREAGDQHVASYSVQGQLAFCPVNGLEWYFFLGSSSSVADVHTIQVLDSGELPTRTLRIESANASENLRYNFTYGKTGQLDFSIGLREKQAFASCSAYLKCDEIKTGEGGYTITPIHPISQELPYKHDSAFAFTWDQGGTPISYEDEVLDFTYTGINSLMAEYVDDQAFANWLLEGNYYHGIQLTLQRGGSTRIFTDAVAQLSSDDFKDCRFKIYQNATQYLQLDFTSCMIIKPDMNKAFSKRKEDTTYRVMMVPKSLVATVKDGIDPTSGTGDHYKQDANYA